MSDIDRSDPSKPAPWADAGGVAPADAEQGPPWRDLLSQVSREIAGPLTSAMERITALTTTGKIDRQSLRALREEVEMARRAGLVGQQLSRYASGRVRQSHERLNLTGLLRDVFVQRARDLQARGLPLRQVLKPAEVVADASLLFALLNALLDWCAEHARSAIDFRIEHTAWPVQAQLICRFAYRAAGDHVGARPAQALDTLSWRLVQQTATTMGLQVEREEAGVESLTTITFPRTVNREVEGASAVELDAGYPSSLNSKPLAGSHVLVLASRRELRVQVREALAQMGLILDFVTSIDEAREFCAASMPHALVYEGVLDGERLAGLREELRAEVPQLVLVEVVEDSEVFEMADTHPEQVARVGRGELASSLPSALVFELSKHL